MTSLSSHALPRVQLHWMGVVLGAIGLFLLSPLLPFRQSFVFATVVINEIFPKPSPDETLEWIELYNTGPDPVSLDGWRLENTAGDKKTYTIPSGITISENKFLTFSQTQTGINLYNEGDTVKLFDKDNHQVDSQSYPSILGYNNSMGRSIDGGGTWTVCASYTRNLPNKCPVPTPLPTPLPTPVPTNTPKPTMTPLPTFTPFPTQPPPTSPIRPLELSQAQVLGLSNQPTPQAGGPATRPADLTDYEKRLRLGGAMVLIAVVWALLVLVAGVERWLKRGQK